MTREIEARIAELDARYAIASIGTEHKDRLVVEFDEAGCVSGYWRFDAFRRLLYQAAPVEVEEVTTKEKKTVYKPIAEYWLRHTNRQYESLVFAPPGSTAVVGRNDYNRWRGLAVNPAEGDWSANRAHIRDVICAGNGDYEKWLHNWIAAMVQKPGEHAHVAILLKGGQGIGKGWFANNQLGGLFRDKNYKHLTDAERVTSKFNSHFEDCVYVFADEAFWENAKAADRLKGLITEDRIQVEKKFCPVETQKSCLHIVIASNHPKPLPIECDDRRLFVLQVDEGKKQDTQHFGALERELKAGGREAMLDYFMRYKVDWDKLRHAPETDAKRELKAASLKPELEWWREVLDTADESSWKVWESRVAKPIVVTKYVEWFDRFGRWGKKMSVDALGQFLRKHFEAGGLAGWPRDGGRVQSATDDRRERTWQFPSLLECRRAFDRATGTRHDWAADEPAAVHRKAA